MTVEEATLTVKNAILGSFREGAEDLIQHMEDIGFFTAPCSGGNHLCCDGGLVVHTANVIENALRLADAMLTKEEFKENFQSIQLCAALHDLGKCGQFGKKYYVENFVQDGKPTKKDPVQKWKRSVTKPFEVNKDLLHVDHNIRSVVEASIYMELTEMEQHAILYHDGLYGSMKHEIAGHETKMYVILHTADLWATKFMEGKEL